MLEKPHAEYWADSDLETVVACPACDAAAPPIARYEGLLDELEHVPGDWAMYRCTRCDTLYLTRRPTISSIHKAYAAYYTHASGWAAHQKDNGDSLMWKLANGYLNAKYGAHRTPALDIGHRVIPLAFPLRQQLDYFYRHLPRVPGRLLDVGCGNGVFLQRAKDAGWTCTGLEPDPLAVMAARHGGLDVVEGTLETLEPMDGFDFISASHVVEHVHNPRQFIRDIAKRLVPGGAVWLATPSADSLGLRWYGPAWRGLEPPRHIAVFSAAALHRLLDEAGFKSIRFHRRGRGANYILKKSHQVAKRSGRKIRALPPWLVDMAASCATSASEELVVTATWTGA